MVYTDPVADQEAHLPLVFQIGEYETTYEHLLTEYPNMLLTVCDNDMSIAYDKWTSFLMDIEQSAAGSDINILGVKLWINVFWDKTGHIQHIAFHLKPNSKNISPQDLTKLLESFASRYQMNIHSDIPYSHYGSAAFPIFPRRVKR